MLTTDRRTPSSPLVVASGGQPCTTACAFAEPLPNAGTARDWIWCHRPAQTTRLRTPGRECAHYVPPALRDLPPRG